MDKGVILRNAIVNKVNNISYETLYNNNNDNNSNLNITKYNIIISTKQGFNYLAK